MYDDGIGWFAQLVWASDMIRQRLEKMKKKLPQWTDGNLKNWLYAKKNIYFLLFLHTKTTADPLHNLESHESTATDYVKNPVTATPHCLKQLMMKLIIVVKK